MAFTPWVARSGVKTPGVLHPFHPGTFPCNDEAAMQDYGRDPPLCFMDVLLRLRLNRQIPTPTFLKILIINTLLISDVKIIIQKFICFLGGSDENN